MYVVKWQKFRSLNFSYFSASWNIFSNVKKQGQTTFGNASIFMHLSLWVVLHWRKFIFIIITQIIFIWLLKSLKEQIDVCPRVFVWVASRLSGKAEGALLAGPPLLANPLKMTCQPSTKVWKYYVTSKEFN